MPRLEPGMARIRVKDLSVRTFIGIKEDEILKPTLVCAGGEVLRK